MRRRIHALAYMPRVLTAQSHWKYPFSILPRTLVRGLEYLLHKVTEKKTVENRDLCCVVRRVYEEEDTWIGIHSSYAWLDQCMRRRIHALAYTVPMHGSTSVWGGGYMHWHTQFLCRIETFVVSFGVHQKIYVPPLAAIYIIIVCVCVCVWERERERERVCLCVCEREYTVSI